MKKFDLASIECPVEYALTILNGKWKILIIWKIAQYKEIRFNELKRQVDGISDVMLSQTLQELEKYGIVYRQQFNEIPPKVQYSLSKFGKGLLPIFVILSDWAKQGGWSNPSFEDKIKNSKVYKEL